MAAAQQLQPIAALAQLSLSLDDPLHVSLTAAAEAALLNKASAGRTCTLKRSTCLARVHHSHSRMWECWLSSKTLVRGNCRGILF
jgi:hypothetical protein